LDHVEGRYHASVASSGSGKNGSRQNSASGLQVKGASGSGSDSQPGRELEATLVVRHIAVNTVHQGMAADIVSMHWKVLEAAIMDLLHRLYQVIIPKLVVLWNPKLVVIVVYEVSAPVGPRLPAVMMGE
jgi:hypothetical protein